MKESYIIAIERPGMGDIPELCRAQSPQAAADLIRYLLECHDPNIRTVKVDISRTAAKEIAV